MVLQVGRRDPHARAALPVLTGTEVAEQRQQRPHLAALVSEMDVVEEVAAPPRPEPPHRLEVVLPVPAADHESCQSTAGRALWPRRRTPGTTESGRSSTATTSGTRRQRGRTPAR